jgi:hypothetical protein
MNAGARSRGARSGAQYQRAGEPGVAQVRQVRLHGQAERPQRPAHGVPDPHDPLGDAITDEQLAFAHITAA